MLLLLQSTDTFALIQTTSWISCVFVLSCSIPLAAHFSHRKLTASNVEDVWSPTHSEDLIENSCKIQVFRLMRVSNCVNAFFATREEKGFP